MNISEKYRLKALACEKTARNVTDPVLRAGWAELAIEWHAMSNRASKLADDDEIEMK